MKAHLDYYWLFLRTRTSRGTLKRTQNLGEKCHTLQQCSLDGAHDESSITKAPYAFLTELVSLYSPYSLILIYKLIGGSCLTLLYSINRGLVIFGGNRSSWRNRCFSQCVSPRHTVMAEQLLNTVDFRSLLKLRSSKVHFRIRKPVCKQRL